MAITKVTTDVITDLAVTAPKLAADSVITAKIADNAVTAAKIAAGALSDQVAGISSSADATAITITSAEKVGIGTTSPAFTLHVLDTIGTRSLSLGHGVSTGTITTDSAKDLNFQQAGTTKMTLDDAGLLGIGTTSPSAPLDVVTDSTVYAAEFTQSNTSNGDGVLVQVGSTASADYALTVRSDAGNTSVLAAKADGKVGIGTFSPQAHLDINTETAEATTVILNGEVNQDKILKFRHYANSEAAGDGYAGFIGSVVDNVLTLGHYNSSNTEVQALHINESGNVGIGITSPATTLHIDASGGAVLRMQRTSANASNKLELSHDGTDGTITSTNDLHLMATNVGIGTTSPAAQLHVATSSGDCTVLIEATENSAAREPHLQLRSYNTSGNPIIEFGDHGGFNGTIEYENQDNSLRFGANAGERMRILSSGKIAFSANGVGDLSSVPRDFAFYTEGATNGLEVRSNDYRLCMIGAGGSGGTAVDSGYVAIASDGNTKVALNSNGESLFGGGHVSIYAGNLYVSGEQSGFSAGSHNGHLLDDNGQSISSRAATNSQTHHMYYNPNGLVGSVTTNASATAFNTSSDYRLKENVVTDWDATTLLKQLKPSKFNFKADKDTTVQGFLAHEVATIVPEAVIGEKDATFSAEEAAENNFAVEGEPKYQQIDHSKLVPLLVKTIQELEARIKTLES